MTLVRRSREHTFSLGSYESIKVGATVEQNYPDDTDPDEVSQDLDEYLDALLAEEINKAAALGVNNPNSAAHDMKTDEER